MSPLAPLRVRLSGVGTYLPEHRVTSQQLASSLGVDAHWIEDTTGVVERRYVSDTDTTVGMASAAANVALENAGVQADELDTIIFAAISRQQLIPCTAVFIQRALRCPEGRSFCFDVDATCLSWMIGLHTASLSIAAGRCQCALVVSSEMASRSLEPKQPESAVLFGDAAAAAVIRPSGAGEVSCLNHALFESHNSGAELTQFQGAGTAHHPNDPLTQPEMNRFHMDGPAIFKLARRLAPPFIERFLGEAGTRRSDYDVVVVHQASIMGVRALTKHLGFSPDQVITNLAQRGNTIAASIPLLLSEAIASGRIERGQRVLMLGTGAGLSLGAMDLVF